MSEQTRPMIGDGVDVPAVQRRTVGVLAGAQTVGSMGLTIGISTASLLALQISGSESQAGLTQTFQVIGTAVASYLLAPLMARHGRRVGLTGAYAVGGLGSLTLVLSGVLDSMLVLMVGSVLLGAISSAGYAARYAATDLAEDSRRARALALVVWATTVGAVAGPNLTGPAVAAARAVGLPELTGPFALGSLGGFAAAAVLWIMLRPDPLILAQQRAGLRDQASSRPSGLSWRRVADVLRTRPRVSAAIAVVSLAHAVMVGVMVMTPLHMAHGGAQLRIIGIVISVHILGMFAFSPIVGWAADAWGRVPVMLTGGVMLVASLAMAGASPEGTSWQIFSGLFLLGLGWSCATVSGSVVIADLVPVESRTDVQGAADSLMALTAAAAAAVSGIVVDRAGYPALNLLAGVFALSILVIAPLARRR
jgi:MFS family permease